MGRKHKHSKDKLHKTVSELSSHHTGPNRELELSALHRRLKFDYCCLTLNPVTIKPMGLCDEDNYCYVFECDQVVKFLEKFQVHPITGRKVSSKDLIELKFHKNNENQYHCPVIYKLLNQHSKIVANKKSGHVYMYEAYHELNLKQNNFKDLLTDEPFDKDRDIVIIQDPLIAERKWNVSEFYYVKKKLKLEEEDNESRIRDVAQSSILKSSIEEYNIKADDILAKFNRIVNQGEQAPSNNVEQLDKINSAAYSDGVLSSSVTSTIAPVANSQKAALLTEEQILYPRIKKKGYVQLVTNYGPLNLELYCDRTPKTCHNFMLLASRGYYDNTIFHRLIKNFIIQAGDPSGTGSGGQSAWGEPFRDECHGDLRHEGRGVLAMANSGPNTNKSQFYITLKGVWDHLDGKHTVFGRVVGGYETLERLEHEVEVDKNDRPKNEVKILRLVKYFDPFEEAEKAIESERMSDGQGNKKNDSSTTGVGPTKPVKKFRCGVGAYINLDQLKSTNNKSSSNSMANVDASATKRAKSSDKEQNYELPSKRLATSSLSTKLAGLSEKQKGSGIKSMGDFSQW